MKDLTTLIEEGKYLYKSRKLKKAESIFKRVVEAKQGYADLHNYLGLIAHEDGRYGEAIKSFKRALKANPSYTEALLNLSILYNDLGQYENAKKLVLRSRKKAKSKKATMDPFIRSKLANKHAEVGDWYHGVGAYKEAVCEYKKSLDLEPRYVDIRTKMAVCIRETGDLATAQAELKRAVADNQHFVDAQIQLGITHYALGKQTEARKIWRQALKISPSNETIKMYLRFTGAR